MEMGQEQEEENKDGWREEDEVMMEGEEESLLLEVMLNMLAALCSVLLCFCTLLRFYVIET